MKTKLLLTFFFDPLLRGPNPSTCQSLKNVINNEVNIVKDKEEKNIASQLTLTQCGETLNSIPCETLEPKKLLTTASETQRSPGNLQNTSSHNCHQENNN
jgi:hypothetical protein